MLIYIEGVDKQGKTTLAKKLCDVFKAEYIKFNQPKLPPFEEYAGFIASIDPDKHYVLDRFFVGELVYGPIYRGKTGVSYGQLAELEKMLLEKQPESVMIYCETSMNEVKKNFVKDKEEFAKLEDIERIREAYHEVLRRVSIPVIDFDYTKDLDHSGVLTTLLEEKKK